MENDFLVEFDSEPFSKFHFFQHFMRFVIAKCFFFHVYGVWTVQALLFQITEQMCRYRVACYQILEKTFFCSFLFYIENSTSVYISNFRIFLKNI